MSNDPNEIVELEVPNDFSKLFDSRFLKAADLNGAHPILEIERVVFEEGPDLKNPKKRAKKGSLQFKGKKKLLGLNRTNILCMKELFGRDPRKWVGHKVGIYPTTTRMPKKGGGGMVDEPCIRIEGSPELERDLTFVLELPMKAPQTITLKKLVDQDAAKGAPAKEGPKP